MRKAQGALFGKFVGLCVDKAALLSQESLGRARDRRVVFGVIGRQGGGERLRACARFGGVIGLTVIFAVAEEPAQ